jgi:uncharacterized protein DUF4386
VTIRRAGRIIGALFLSGFLFYGGGSFLIASTTDNATPLPQNAASLGQLSAGATLLLLNSVAVAAIGILAFRVLRSRHRRTANVYLAARGVEAALLALAPLATLTLVLVTRGDAGASNADSAVQSLARTAVENSESAYWIAMATLSVGSIFFCRTLLTSALLPRLLAVWGMVGYAAFAFGSVMQLAGFGVGLALSAPGGLFELAAGSYLLVKGFGAEPPQSLAGTYRAPTPTTAGLTTSHAAR